MLEIHELKKIVCNQNLSRKEKILSVLAVEDRSVKTVSDIRNLAVKIGLREAQKWNISQILKDTKGLAIRLQNGWEISESGLKHLEELGLLRKSPIKRQKTELRKYTNSISSPTVRAFLEESVTALEYRLLRSAVVLSWVGALSVLYEVVIKKHLKDFNAEAQRRSSNWKPAKTLDDLTAMKEYDFLQMITSISVIEGRNGLR